MGDLAKMFTGDGGFGGSAEEKGLKSDGTVSVQNTGGKSARAYAGKSAVGNPSGKSVMTIPGGDSTDTTPGGIKLQDVDVSEEHLDRGGFYDLINPAAAAGDVRASEDTTYSKTYLFYSGSIIDKTSFHQRGYQDDFIWADHVYTYANQTTTYSTTQVYTIVGQTSHTVVGLGSPPVENTSTVYEYEWITTEDPSGVDVVQNMFDIYVQPSTIGIMSEVDKYVPPVATPVGDWDGSESHTIEEEYTDNPMLEFSHTTLIDSETGNSVETVQTTIGQAETMFLNDHLGDSLVMTGVTPAEFLDQQIDKYALTIYNSSLVTRNTYTTTDPAHIRQANLREIATIETMLSSSINTNLSDGVTTTEAELTDLGSSGFTTTEYEY